MSQKSMAMPLKQLFDHAAMSPGSPFMVKLSGGKIAQTYTWAEAADEVCRCAGYLKSLDLPAKSRIAILAKNSPHWVIADLAIWMAGHISVPVYPTISIELIKYTLEHCKAELLFVGKTEGWENAQDALLASIKVVALPEGPSLDGVTTWETVQSNAPLSVEDSAKVDASDVATIIYTSGTTGLPKGVVHTFSSIGYSVSNFSKLTGLKFGDRVISYLPMSHVGERLSVELQSLCVGLEVYFNEAQETFIADLKTCNPSIFMAVPRIWSKLHQGLMAMLPSNIKQKIESRDMTPEEGRAILSTIGLGETRYGACAAAPVSIALLEWYASLGLPIVEAYGMTENFGYSHMGSLSASKTGFVGPTNPGVSAKLSEEGEILVKSEATMAGYYLDEVQTASAFDGSGYYKTGDRGYVDADGWLKVIGRVKDIFKTSKGKYVVPSPIESALIDTPFIDQVCVVGSGRPQPLALAIVSDAGSKYQEDELRASLQHILSGINSKLEPHERLSCLVAVKDQWTNDNGFITPTLKIKRNVVETYYGPLLERIDESVSGVFFEREL